jgi:hypothetical protein
MDTIRTKRLELEAMICQNMDARERRITLGLLREYEEMLVKNCNAPAVSVTVCDGCENKSLCKKHGVLGINCIRLNVKQTER